MLYPARHHVTPKDQVQEACKKIEDELEERLKELNALGETSAAQRLQQRTQLDLNLLRETGFCQGMENYRYTSGIGLFCRMIGLFCEMLVSFDTDGYRNSAHKYLNPQP